MYWVMRRVPLWRLTCRHAAEAPNHSPEHLPYQGRALVHHPRHGRARPEEPRAAARQIQRAGRSAAAAARYRSAGAPGAGHGRQRRGAGAYARRRAALCPRLDLQGHAVARGAGCRACCGRRCASRTRTRSTSTGWRATPLPTCSTRSTAARSAIRPANGSATRRAGRSDGARRCSARTPRRCSARRRGARACRPQPRRVENPRRSALHDKPFPLQGIKILDFAWFLASAGGTRFLAAMGAESFKVEWKDNPDTRLAAMAPVGGRAARDAATGPLPGVRDPDMGGQFNNKNAGKRGISLNIRHPKGLADRQGHGAHLRCRRRGVFAGRAAAARPRLRRAEEHPARHHLHPAIRHGRARHLWPDAHGRPGRRGVWRAGRDVGPARAGDAGRLGLFLSRLDGRLRLRAGACSARSITASAPARASGSTPRNARAASS